MTEAVTRNIGTTRCAEKIPHRSRLVCADGHPSNRKCEDNLELRRPGWAAWFLWCELHLVAIIMRESLMSLAQDVARGTLYTALGVGHGETMMIFRECLYLEIISHLDICTGAPPPAAVAYRAAMMDLFF